MKLLILGAGYSARHIARKLAPLCVSISGTTRTVESFPAAASQYITPIFFDGVAFDEELMIALRDATHLLVTVPPQISDAEENIPEEFNDPLAALIQSELSGGKNASNLQWIGYLSTVGVYGNFDGGWVDEATICKPVSARSIARLRAEKSWQELSSCFGIRLCVLRLSGIYGPGRNALVNLSKGSARRIVKPGQVFNRIHVGDIATAVKLAADKAIEGTLNITDDCPAPPQDVVSYAAGLMRMQVPPEIPFSHAQLSPLGFSFYSENKRVSNSLSKTVLGLNYDYPNYRRGINALWINKKWQRSF